MDPGVGQGWLKKGELEVQVSAFSLDVTKDEAQHVNINPDVSAQREVLLCMPHTTHTHMTFHGDEHDSELDSDLMI